MQRGVGEEGLVAGDEAVEVIGVGVTQEGVRDFLGGDRNRGERIGNPADLRLGATAEPGVEDRDRAPRC